VVEAKQEPASTAQSRRRASRPHKARPKAWKPPASRLGPDRRYFLSETVWTDLFRLLWPGVDLVALRLTPKMLVEEARSEDSIVGGEMHTAAMTAATKRARQFALEEARRPGSTQSRQLEEEHRREQVRLQARQVVLQVERVVTYQKRMDEIRESSPPRDSRVGAAAALIAKRAQALLDVLLAVDSRTEGLLWPEYEAPAATPMAGDDDGKDPSRPGSPDGLDDLLDGADTFDRRDRRWEHLPGELRSLVRAAVSVQQDSAGIESRGKARNDSLRVTVATLRGIFRRAHRPKAKVSRERLKLTEADFVRWILEDAGVDLPADERLARDYPLNPTRRG